MNILGRPLKFKNKKNLEAKIEDYFESCFFTNGNGVKEQKRPFTITGLALALDTSRETLINYEHRDEFFDTIKRAKLRIENYAEERLFGSNVTGVIFNLKNNYGWEDKKEFRAPVGLDFSYLSDEELDEKIKEAEKINERALKYNKK